MDIGIISKRYARALLQFAREQQLEERVHEECQTFAHTWKLVPQVRTALENPLLSEQEKVDIICQAAGIQASAVFRKFAALVVAHHREAYIYFMVHSYETLYRDFKGIKVGTLTTAVPVTEETIRHLMDWMKQKFGSHTAIMLEKEVNPEILGGFVLEIDHQRLDASVYNQLEHIKKQIIENNKRII